MKTIPLTRGKAALIDDEDYERVNQYKWTAKPRTRRGITYGWVARRNQWFGDPNVQTVMKSSKGDRIVNGYYKNLHLHRFIMNAPEGMVVDHIDGNGLNNQKSNLRICTHSQNAMNSRTRSSNSTGVRGVSFDSQTGKWRATITHKGKMKNLGRYKELEEAIGIRKEAEKEIFGDFAK